MRFLVVSTLLLASLAAGQNADAIEIQKQRLVKFPEEFDPNVAPPTSDKADEAKRILEQIAKVNEAFGYVKKRPNQPKLPPILDSSQYLFPKPAQQPFHAQQHHFSGSMGQTLLEPSIRAVKLTRNAMPPKQQLYFRPNRVQLPKPSSEQEAKQLPAHFVIPVHLYKLNKEQYLREQAPQEYRIKGYKIIGDVDSFYGKAKAMNEKQNKKQTKSTPKYHLFFLPRELALNEDGTLKRGTASTTTATTKMPTGTKESRVDSREKQTTKPQTQSQSQSQTQSQPQRIPGVVAPTTHSNRKRINAANTIKPKEAEQMLPKVTSAPIHSTSDLLSTLPPAGGLLNNRNRLSVFRVPNVNLAQMQNQTSTAIKNAFQNIFKMPFSTPTALTGTTAAQQPVMLQSTPLQPPEHSDSLQDDYKWDDEKEGGGDGSDLDTLEQIENTAAEQDSSVAAEKHLFAHKHHQLMNTIGTVATAHHGTQKQALREGGIIIQRLKVRKGGIAIAGPGGVATAGSGGTAIVGPGGYALTHPRSLTIAGPGAKVISIPSDVDLKDALLRTDVGAKSFPREGKVVAIGPTVYYAPPTGKLSVDYDDDEMNEEFESLS
ncbi:uncharacterized protein LOC6556554 isoform X1 [Drosophila grimshawi]|uniref:GH15130 n=1 Tax=Drosophila grimshawi TaxID=7222 RepID=B4IYB5_DROGR|nr:uncharacterized protein LOC6556554 isoform X1 [Drosophila grimshawi]EDV96565.1 GH15130 [Drosophila grimshawi]